jgi:hypothetical protein
VTARFTRRAADDYAEHHWFKTIVRPEAVEAMDSPHSAVVRRGAYVMADGAPLDRADPHPGIAARIADGPIRLHHYITKSEEEYRAKQSRWIDAADRPDAVRAKYDDGYFHGRQAAAGTTDDGSAAAFRSATRVVLRQMMRHAGPDPRVIAAVRAAGVGPDL